MPVVNNDAIPRFRLPGLNHQTLAGQLIPSRNTPNLATPGVATAPAVKKRAGVQPLPQKQRSQSRCRLRCCTPTREEIRLFFPPRFHIQVGWRMIGELPADVRFVFELVIGIRLLDGVVKSRLEGWKVLVLDRFANRWPILGEELVEGLFMFGAGK